MNWREEQDFLERQLNGFHKFLDELQFYKNGIYNIAKMMNSKMRSEKIGADMHSVTVAYCTNFRDCFWHYGRILKEIEKTSGNPDEKEVHMQYRMILEHFNRATIDLLIDLLLKLYNISRIYTHVYCEAIKKDDLKAKFKNKHEQICAEKRLLEFKNGYLVAREAILLLRSKRGEYRLISAQSEFASPDDYDENTRYYNDVVERFAQSFSSLCAALPRHICGK